MLDDDRTPPHDAAPAQARADLNDRQAEIVARVRERGFVTVETLAREFGVSAQTIRRDIIVLDGHRLLQRFHGGAGLAGGPVRLGYEEKRAAAVDAKERIGRAAAGMVRPGSAVFLDVGTTNEAAARALAGVPGLRVFTPSMPAALVFAGRDGVETFVTGGTVRGADGSLAGDEATSAVRRFRFDVAFIGLSGFDADGAPMDFDLAKVAVKQAAIAAARRAVALADAAKFRREAIVRIAPASAFSALVCDAPPAGRLADALASAAVDVVVAD